MWLFSVWFWKDVRGITCGWKVTGMSVTMQVAPSGKKNLGGRGGPRRGRVADVLHGRTVVETAANLHVRPAALVVRAATLYERAAPLGTLRERAALHVRAEAGAPHERAGALNERTGERAASVHW